MQPHAPGELRDCRKDSNEAARKKLKPPPVKESPIVACLTGAAVKQAIAKAARSLAEGKSEDVIAQVGSLVEENALLRNEIASLAKRLDKVRSCRAGRDQEGRRQGAEQKRTSSLAAIGASSTR
jgi:hypothetical protein